MLVSLTALLASLVAAVSNPDRSATLVMLEPGQARTAARALSDAGATLAVPEMRLWYVGPEVDPAVLQTLERRGAVHLSSPVRENVGTLSTSVHPDPLSGQEWWRAKVGIDGLTPPGPGKPVTIVDSGLDVNHPEFTGRPNTETLNVQEPQPLGGEHGTMVASVIGAPENGAGIVGIYPQAVLRSWDAAIGQGTQLDSLQIVQGIVAAARRGPGVINLSLGGNQRDPVVEQAVMQAVARGSLVVAASGNDGEVGNPPGYPAFLPHVLTVAATNRNDAITSFSSQSPHVDLSAPGADIVVASALNAGWQTASGTSFSAPLVSGASAWVWTERPELDATQLFEVMRRSARDIGPPGKDWRSGFGVLNVRNALAQPAPVRDPLEPNDDMNLVDPASADAVGIAPLTTKQRTSTTIKARFDLIEDPRDVYRVWLPKGRALTATTSGVDVDLTLLQPGTASVASASGRLAHAATRGNKETLRYANKGGGRYVYLAVTPPRGKLSGTYTLTVRAR
jgi:subtilisin family serine protease